MFLASVNELQIQTLLDLAVRHQENGRLLHAIQILTQIVQSSPKCDRAYVQLAQVYVEMKRPEQAEKILLEGSKANKENLEYTLMLGNLHLHQQHFDRALQYFGSLKHLNIPQIHQSIGLIYYFKGDLCAAEEELQRAILVDPELPKIHELLGEVQLRLGKVDEAVHLFLEALQRDPYSGAAHRFLGEAYLERKSYVQALNEFTQAIDCLPDEAPLWELCGTVLIELERFPEAKSYLERSRELNPKVASTHVQLGYVFTKLGENSKALESFEAALALEPDNSEALRLQQQLIN